MAVKKGTNNGNDFKSNTLKDMPNIPIDFEYEVTDLNSVVDRSESFDYLLKLWWSILENTQTYGNCSSVIKV